MGWCTDRVAHSCLCGLVVCGYADMGECAGVPGMDVCSAMCNTHTLCKCLHLSINGHVSVPVGVPLCGISAHFCVCGPTLGTQGRVRVGTFPCGPRAATPHLWGPLVTSTVFVCLVPGRLGRPSPLSIASKMLGLSLRVGVPAPQGSCWASNWQWGSGLQWGNGWPGGPLSAVVVSNWWAGT